MGCSEIYTCAILLGWKTFGGQECPAVARMSGASIIGRRGEDTRCRGVADRLDFQLEAARA